MSAVSVTLIKEVNIVYNPTLPRNDAAEDFGFAFCNGAICRHTAYNRFDWRLDCMEQEQ